VDAVNKVVRTSSWHVGVPSSIPVPTGLV